MVRTSSGCQCGGSFQPAENLTRETNTPGFVGSPYRTTVCGGPASGPLNSISCGSLRTPMPVPCAKANADKPTVPKANTRYVKRVAMIVLLLGCKRAAHTVKSRQ